MRRSTEPFGGIQLIICGDFLQLPPVSKGKEKAGFCFQVRRSMFVLFLYEATKCCVEATVPTQSAFVLTPLPRHPAPLQARCWRKVIQHNLELTEVRRQTDQSFISLLQAVRVGR